MKYIKKNIKYIGIIIICFFSSFFTTLATNFAFESSEVTFNNTGTNIQSNNVQNALTEAYNYVTDYSGIKTKIGNSPLITTSQDLIGAVNEIRNNLETISLEASPKLNDLESQLTLIGALMADYEVKNIRFNVPSGGYGILKQAVYIGTIKRAAVNRYNISVQEFGVDGTIYTANSRNGVWNWSLVGSLKKLEYTFTEDTIVPAGGRITVTSSSVTSGIGLQYVNALIYNSTSFTGWSNLSVTIVVNDSNGYISVFNKTANDITIPSGAKAIIWFDSAYARDMDHIANPANYSDRIHFIKQSSNADAILLESNGRFAMVDTGLESDASNVLSYLNSLGVTKLEFVLITHAHTDHMGGLPYLIDNIPISKLFYKEYDVNKGGGSLSLINRVEQGASAKGINIIYVDKFSESTAILLGDMQIYLYNVPQNTYNTVHTFRTGEVQSAVNANSNSILELIKINGFRVFLTGDLYDEEHNISYFTELSTKSDFKNLDLLKMPHHGSVRSAFGSTTDDGPYNVTALNNFNPAHIVVTHTDCTMCSKSSFDVSGMDVRYVNSTSSNALVYSLNGVISITP